MRVCLLTQYYPPEVTGIGPFTGELARFLAAKGMDVTVIAPYPHYPRWSHQPPFERRRPRRQSERTGGVNLIRKQTYIPSARPNTAARIRYDSSLALASLREVRIWSDAQVGICISPPLQLTAVGALARFGRGVPMILHLQDLVPDAAVAVGMMSDSVLLKVARIVERIAYKSATHISVISPAFRDNIMRKGIPASKITVLPNWVSLAAPNPKTAADFRAKLGIRPDQTLVLYSGNIGRKQGLEMVVNAAQLADRGIHFVIVGAGTERALLAAQMDRMPTTRVSLADLQTDFPSTLAAADILLLPQLEAVTESVAPSKLLSYMAAGRPIIAAVNGQSAAARLVADSGAGMIIPPEDPAALVEAVKTLQADSRRCTEMASAGRHHVGQHFGKERILEKWLRLVESVSS